MSEENKTEETKPTEAKPTEAKPAETKPAERTASSDRPAPSGRPSGGRPGGGGGGRPGGSRPPFRGKPGGNRRGGGFFKKKGCRYCKNPDVPINYKDARALRPFLTDKGKIMPRRITGNCAKHQRTVQNAIKRARNMAIIPYTAIVL